jgi:2'-5' RNA ligase
MVDSTHLENDKFGYSCYTIVAPAPDRLTDPLLAIEHASGQERAKIPGHVTVKGTFYGIESLESLLESIREVAKRHEPFDLATEGFDVWESEHSLILGFKVNTLIQALHDDLMADIGPLGNSAYSDDPYRSHMSIVNEVSPNGVEIAKAELAKVDLGEQLRFDSVDLMARDGVAYGGVWKRVERFRLGNS